MKLSTVAAVALVTLVVSAGAVAAMPGNAPATGSSPDHRQDDPDRAVNGSTAPANATSQARNDEAGGPPLDMPEQVPDHVSQIHRAIVDFLSGVLEGDLGETVRDLTPGNRSANPAEASG